ncbi:MAG: hypothetical protein JW863_20375 [Chitinispirillaceae bacterium]|nr:hypothetical protein [Chitinispirillaceae bacterium]
MDWLWKHKLVLVLGIVAVAYWFYNPADRFGYVRKGLIVYNRIPVAFFDCYIDPDGKLFLESDLSVPNNQNYWFEQHFSNYQNHTPNTAIPLYIGTGFDGAKQFHPNEEMLRKCRIRGFEPAIMSSGAAITRFNGLRQQQKKCALLLKLH